MVSMVEQLALDFGFASREGRYSIGGICPGRCLQCLRYPPEIAVQTTAGRTESVLKPNQKGDG